MSPDDPADLSKDPPPVPLHGVLVRAKNGDVIRYDSSGVVLRLADRVIEDIAMRLEGRFSARAGAGVGPTSSEAGDLPQALEDIDAWNIRADGTGDIRFTARLPGRQGLRDYRMDATGRHIVADTQGAVQAILGIGGPRAALANAREADYPFHILAPADDIGAVGVAGIERAARIDMLSPLREMTHEALVAEAFLGWQMEKHAPLPLFVVRTETDSSANAAELAGGQALGNLLIAAENVKHAAARLGKPARIRAVCLDFGLEDLGGSARQYRDAMLALMARVEEEFAVLGFDRPLFVARFDAGRPGLVSDAVVEGQWELMWNHGDHRLLGSAPGYMFGMDDYDRPTETARRHMAEMTAAAIAAEAAGTRHDDPLTRGWRCPILHLAEWEGESPVLRVVIRAQGDLTLIPSDEAGFVHPVGFRLEGPDVPRIERIAIAPDDPQSLLLHLDRRPEGVGLHLCYGYGTPDPDVARCAIRDGWSLLASDGWVLGRWAMPARLPVHDGAIAG
ncbi:MAG: hypothetical protein ACK5M4_16330 [Pseudorhodobacter sp.]